jgi:hypothetical protein
MPPRLAMSAIEWMELRAMQAGLRGSDRTLVDSWWWRDLSAAEALEEAGQELAAAFRLQAMTRDYVGLRPPAQMEDLAARVARLSVNPLVSAGVRARDEGAARHEARLERLLQVLADAFLEDEDIARQSVDATVQALGIADLRRTAAGPVPAAALEAKRVLAELDVQVGFYLPVEALRVDDDARAAFYLEVHAAIDPIDSFAFFLRGKMRARAGQHGAAIDALRQALQLGFRSVDLVETDPAFATMRGRPDFQALIAELRAWWETQPPR